MSDIEGFGRRTRGLSGMAFQEAYGREEPCRAALFEWRWGRGGPVRPAVMAVIAI